MLCGLGGSRLLICTLSAAAEQRARLCARSGYRLTPRGVPRRARVKKISFGASNEPPHEQNARRVTRTGTPQKGAGPLHAQGSWSAALRRTGRALVPGLEQGRVDRCFGELGIRGEELPIEGLRQHDVQGVVEGEVHPQPHGAPQEWEHRIASDRQLRAVFQQLFRRVRRSPHLMGPLATGRGWWMRTRHRSAQAREGRPLGRFARAVERPVRDWALITRRSMHRRRTSRRRPCSMNERISAVCTSIRLRVEMCSRTPPAQIG